MIFAISAVLLVYVSVAIARALARDNAEGFWLALAAAALQLGSISLLLSFVQGLTPVAFLVAQLVLAVIAWRVQTQKRAASRGSRARALIAKPGRGLLLIAIVIILGGYVFLQARTPLSHFDDRMYRGSRAAYWLQHRSLLPWETHNDRQVAFPFGSELVFFWPLLMTRSEVVGRTVFGLIAPLCATGLYLVMREARASRTAALAGVLLLLVTPQVTRTFSGLSPESWLALHALGVGFFALRAARSRGRVSRHFVMIGLFVALAMNVKATAAVLVPVALILPWIVVRGKSWWPRVKAVAAGGVIGGALSGIGLLLCTNFLREGHPLGPPMMVAVHSANLSAQQVRTHIARFLVSMIDLAVVPGHTVQTRLTESGRRFLALCGADQPLTLESSRERWPGSYSFDSGDGSLRFSSGGLMWVAVLASTVAGTTWDMLRRGGRARLGSSGMLGLLSLALLSFTVITVRWMGQIERFWVAAYVLGIPLIALEMMRAVRRRPRMRYVVAAVLLITAALPIRGLSRAVTSPGPTADATRLLDEPFFKALQHMPPGSRILLVAGQSVRDYPLFAPRQGYVNSVFPWGHEPFSPIRLASLIAENDITHVVLESDVRIAQRWQGYLSMVEMAQWLRSQPDWTEIAREETAIPLFVRRIEHSAATR